MDLDRSEVYRAIFENSHDAVLLTRPADGAILAANRAACTMFGHSEQELLARRRDDLLDPADSRFAEASVERTDAGSVVAELTFIRKSGERFAARVSSSLFMDEREGQVASTSIQDISERKHAEEAFRHSEERFRLLYEHAPLGIAECGIDGRFVQVNSKLTAILGYSKDELTGLTFADVTHPADMERTLTNLQKLTTGQAASYAEEKRYIRKDRSLVWVNVTASLASVHGKPQYLVVTVEDITARRIAEGDLKRAMESSYHQANHDMLTGLANRASFADRLKEALAYARRDGHLVALHVLDLDRFKSVNDTLGHHIGDLLLKDVARRIKSHVRATDLAARLGGDEFVVIQTHLTEPSAAGVVAGKLIEDLKRTYVLDNHEVESGASIGVAIYPDDADDPDGLMNRADLALYDAKNRGRFNCQFYRRELGAAVQESQRLEQELLRALREGEFFLNYQPQFDLKSGRVTGIEALLRWQHPTRGRLAAAEFIHDAERARLMLPIGEWVIRTACRQFKRWIDSGLSVPLTLHLSAMQLRDPRLLDTLRRILDETGVPASMLQLAMREGVLWDPKFSADLLTRMKESGLRLAIHGFGTEMTALATLDRFPLDAVKPGPDLVKALPARQHAATVLNAIVDVAHNLHIAVCAHGVETANQLTSVKDGGCDSAQGYLLSAPLDTHEMAKLMGTGAGGA